MKKILYLGIFFLSLSSLQAEDALPLLLDSAPNQSFNILGPVSATEKKVEAAQDELLHQAQKLNADAVILKNCQPGSIQRNGLSWSKAQASCEGLAIQFNLKNPPKPSSKASNKN